MLAVFCTQSEKGPRGRGGAEEVISYKVRKFEKMISRLPEVTFGVL